MNDKTETYASSANSIILRADLTQLFMRTTEDEGSD